MKRKISDRIVFLYLPLWIAILLILFPFYWAISVSFKTNADVMSKVVHYFPHPITGANYLLVWNSVGFSVFFKNSLLVALMTVAVVLVFSILVGYAISRFKFRGKTAFMLLLLCTQFIPGAMLLIPLFMIFKTLGMTGHLSSLVVTYTTFQLPFNAILMSGFISNIPEQLEEAAMVDGCSRLKVIFYIVFPLLIPGIIATSVFTFIGAWNDFLFALMFISNSTNFTIPVGLSYMIGEFDVNYGALAAGSVIALIPTVMLFALIQKYLVQGIMTGAVKG